MFQVSCHFEMKNAVEAEKPQMTI